MINALLDHPWPLDSALSNPDSALKRFNDWIREHPSVEPTRFIPLAEYEAVLAKMSARRERTLGDAFFRRFAYDYVLFEAGVGLATPVPEVEGIQNSWKQALHRAMQDVNDWRTPQIIVAKERERAWPKTDEVEITVAANVANERRVLARLEEYEKHPYASSDFDPWDLQRCHRQMASRLGVFPRRLPKHPHLANVPVGELPERLEVLRQDGWRYNIEEHIRFFYIPPANWAPLGISANDWRHNCKTFPRQEASGRRGSGFVDYCNRVWVWDRQKHTHWDVQFPTKGREDNPLYCVISDEGELVRDPDGVCSPTSGRR